MSRSDAKITPRSTLNERTHADQPPVQEEREQRPRDDTDQQRRYVAPERAFGICRARDAVTMSRDREVDYRPHQERAKQHQVVQHAGSEQMVERQVLRLRRMPLIMKRI